MNLVELDQALRKLRLSGMADVLETRLLQAQTEQMAPIDLLAALVSDELQRREDRLLARRHKQARFRDPDRSLDGFDFAFTRSSFSDIAIRPPVPKPFVSAQDRHPARPRRATSARTPRPDDRSGDVVVGALCKQGRCWNATGSRSAPYMHPIRESERDAASSVCP